MRISNRTYDIIKWVALALLPALEALILTIGKIWEPAIPYYAETGATIAAVGVFLAAIIRVSSNTYYDELTQPTDEDLAELILEDEEEEAEDDSL